jgi:broad specificity phosphatase PhoE
MNRFTIINTIRHGETNFNVEKRYAGTIDVPLSENGRKDTLEASRNLKGMSFDAVITSSLKRSIETAQLLMDGDVSLVRCELCNERNYGRMQGLTSTEVEFIKPKIKYIKVEGDYHSLNPPMGESFRELRARAKKFREYIFNNYRGLNVLVISHGTFLQQFHGLIQGKSWIESLGICIKNLEFTSFRYKGNRLLEMERMILAGRKQKSW